MTSNRQRIPIFTQDQRNRQRPQNIDAGQGNQSARNIAKLSACALCGTLFGFTVEKGKVCTPEAASSQMLMEKFLVMKIFLAALASGMFGMSILSMLPFTRRMYLQARTAYVTSLTDKGPVAVCVGAFILGSGIALVGTCPAMLFVQVATGFHNAGFTCLGVFLGTLVYGIVDPYVTHFMKPTKPVRYQFMHQWYGTPYFVLSFPISALISFVVFSLEMFYPSSEELQMDLTSTAEQGIISAKAWPPFFCGCLIGSLQIPLVLIMGKTIAGSRYCCTFVSQALVTDSLKEIFPYLTKYQTGLENWWQVVFIMGTALGSYLSAICSGTYGTYKDASPVTSVVGGFLIIFGARISNGCSSGHVLSGLGLLSTLSMASTLSLLAGGMLTAFVTR